MLTPNINETNLAEKADQTALNSPLFIELNPTEADMTKGGCGGFNGGRRSNFGSFSSFFSGISSLFGMAIIANKTKGDRSYNGNFNVTALNQTQIGDNNNIIIL